MTPHKTTDYEGGDMVQDWVAHPQSDEQELNKPVSGVQHHGPEKGEKERNTVTKRGAW